MFLTKSFESNEIRFVEIDGEHYIVAVDLLKASGSTTTVTALEAMIEEGLGKGFVNNQLLPTSGGVQRMLVLKEAAFTYYLSRSRTEAGRKLNRWIHAEVLPSIRQTGSYSISNTPRVLPEPLKVTETLIELDKSTLPAAVKQLLIDSCVDAYLTNQAVLPNSKDRWLGVAQRAEELGIKLNPGLRSQLGKFIKRKGFESRKIEERLCNGQMRPINVYQVSDDLDTAISEFFAVRAQTRTQRDCLKAPNYLGAFFIL